MRRMPYTILLCLAACLTACREDALPTGEERTIRLSVDIESLSATRVPYTHDIPTHDIGSSWMKAAVYASTTDRDFPNTGENGNNADGKVAIHSKINIQGAKDQLMVDAVYPKTGDDVHFVAMYPETLEEGKSLWMYDAGATTVTHTFSGNADVMFAPQVTGQYGNANPELCFHHLLTWLRIELVAESEEASLAWGAIEGMTLYSKDEVTIDLGKGAYYDRITDVTFDGGANMPFYLTEDGKPTDKLFPTALDGGKYYLRGIPANDTDHEWDDFIEEVAYVMCAPETAVTSGAEYVLTISTANRGEVEVPVDLTAADGAPFAGSTMGHQFTILLKFKIGENISVLATTRPWSTGGISSEEVTE